MPEKTGSEVVFFYFFIESHFSSLHPNSASSVRRTSVTVSSALISPCSLASPSSETHRPARGLLLASFCSLSRWFNWMDQRGRAQREREGGGERRHVPSCDGITRTRCIRMVIASRGIFHQDTRPRSPFHHQLMRYLSEWSCVSLCSEAMDILNSKKTGLFTICYFKGAIHAKKRTHQASKTTFVCLGALSL